MIFQIICISLNALKAVKGFGWEKSIQVFKMYNLTYNLQRSGKICSNTWFNVKEMYM